MFYFIFKEYFSNLLWLLSYCSDKFFKGLEGLEHMWMEEYGEDQLLFCRGYNIVKLIWHL